ncbi:hypothetical protein JOB18_007011 [Solea senegalensis]|nr:hypothetical protein JOB18_007011 [Solea senegalensis]
MLEMMDSVRPGNLDQKEPSTSAKGPTGVKRPRSPSAPKKSCGNQKVKVEEWPELPKDVSVEVGDWPGVPKAVAEVPVERPRRRIVFKKRRTSQQGAAADVVELPRPHPNSCEEEIIVVSDTDSVDEGTVISDTDSEGSISFGCFDTVPRSFGVRSLRESLLMQDSEGHRSWKIGAKRRTTTIPTRTSKRVKRIKELVFNPVRNDLISQSSFVRIASVPVRQCEATTGYNFRQHSSNTKGHYVFHDNRECRLTLSRYLNNRILHADGRQRSVIYLPVFVSLVYPRGRERTDSRRMKRCIQSATQKHRVILKKERRVKKHLKMHTTVRQEEDKFYGLNLCSATCSQLLQQWSIINPRCLQGRTIINHGKFGSDWTRIRKVVAFDTIISYRKRSSSVHSPLAAHICQNQGPTIILHIPRCTGFQDSKSRFRGPEPAPKLINFCKRIRPGVQTVKKTSDLRPALNMSVKDDLLTGSTTPETGTMVGPVKNVSVLWCKKNRKNKHFGDVLQTCSGAGSGVTYKVLCRSANSAAEDVEAFSCPDVDGELVPPFGSEDSEQSRVLRMPLRSSQLDRIHDGLKHCSHLLHMLLPGLTMNDDVIQTCVHRELKPPTRSPQNQEVGEKETEKTVQQSVVLIQILMANIRIENSAKLLKVDQAHRLSNAHSKPSDRPRPVAEASVAPLAADDTHHSVGENTGNHRLLEIQATRQGSTRILMQVGSVGWALSRVPCCDFKNLITSSVCFSLRLDLGRNVNTQGDHPPSRKTPQVHVSIRSAGSPKRPAPQPLAWPQPYSPGSSSVAPLGCFHCIHGIHVKSFTKKFKVPSTWVTVSGVPPFIPNEALAQELKRFGRMYFKCVPVARVSAVRCLWRPVSLARCCLRYLLLKKSHVVDTWRMKHPDVKEYTWAKAFDHVDHDLFSTLQAFVVGGSFLSWVQLLYSEACCVVKVGGGLSRPIPVRRGIRQGCPISGQLYSITIKSLLCRPRSRLGGLVLAELGQSPPVVVLAHAEDVNVFIQDQRDVQELEKSLLLRE